MKRNKTHEFGKRLIFTFAILAIYMVGRNILLFGIDADAFRPDNPDSYNLLMSMISGDRYRHTVFALGIMPYISASLTLMVYMAIRGSDYKSRTSPQKMERMTFILMFPFALMSAISFSTNLIFGDLGISNGVLRFIAIIEMIIGAVIIFKMAELNKNHGIGGQTAIICVNVLDNFLVTAGKVSWLENKELLILCVAMAVIILVIENALIRVPVQRVSIHNIYADKSYIAFKLNPIGVMPVMFASSFFMIPQFIISFFLYLDKDNAMLQGINESLKFTDLVGVIVYLAIIFILDVAFSFIMLSPGDIATNLQKSGDSIVGIYAGKKTKQYLRGKVLLLSSISGILLCSMMGTSLVLSLRGDISSDLALFPATVMILIGLICPICQEIKSYIRYDSYSFFI